MVLKIELYMILNLCQLIVTTYVKECGKFIFKNSALHHKHV